ncbi:zinc finger domain-containing protein [Bradyrhizobium ivorense]|uniref:zinc finger domain-containing protein n=1 Tax=Bradyrhizobium ivorense TaxID=2511166 RepID=UPI003D310C97
MSVPPNLLPSSAASAAIDRSAVMVGCPRCASPSLTPCRRGRQTQRIALEDEYNSSRLRHEQAAAADRTARV